MRSLTKRNSERERERELYLVDVLVEMGMIEGLGEQDVGFGSTHLGIADLANGFAQWRLSLSLTHSDFEFLGFWGFQNLIVIALLVNTKK